jgi:hypothetical protein
MGRCLATVAISLGLSITLCEARERPPAQPDGIGRCQVAVRLVMSAGTVAESTADFVPGATIEMVLGWDIREAGGVPGSRTPERELFGALRSVGVVASGTSPLLSKHTPEDQAFVDDLAEAIGAREVGAAFRVDSRGRFKIEAGVVRGVVWPNRCYGRGDSPKVHSV